MSFALHVRLIWQSTGKKIECSDALRDGNEEFK